MHESDVEWIEMHCCENRVCDLETVKAPGAFLWAKLLRARAEPRLNSQGNRPRPQILILIKRTYTYGAHFIECIVVHSKSAQKGGKELTTAPKVVVLACLSRVTSSPKGRQPATKFLPSLTIVQDWSKRRFLWLGDGAEASAYALYRTGERVGDRARQWCYALKLIFPLCPLENSHFS